MSRPVSAAVAAFAIVVVVAAVVKVIRWGTRQLVVVAAVATVAMSRQRFPKCLNECTKMNEKPCHRHPLNPASIPHES